jgi:hypothetical protein
MAESKDAKAPEADKASANLTSSLPDPKTLGKLRSGRDDNRPSEDDIAKQRMGPRGLPGEPPPANDLRESETQMPKGLDPGHTA